MSLLLTVLPGTLSAEERVPGMMPPIGKGVFLVASPNLIDPNFRQTVVLIFEYGPEGTIGVIVNRPTGFLLSEALPNFPMLRGTSHVIFFGGPVQPNGIHVLFRTGKQPPDTRQVLEGVYVGGNMEALERMITQPKPNETFRLYAGYAGWAPGQLEYEMARGSWATLPADSESIFDKEPTSLWPDSLTTLKGPRVIRSGVANDGTIDGRTPINVYEARRKDPMRWVP